MAHPAVSNPAVELPTRIPIPDKPIPLRTLAPWAVFGALLAIVLLYFIGAEEGAASIIGGTWVHEFAHDGRHLLGFPCH
jgi:hypothetical protein